MRRDAFSQFHPLTNFLFFVGAIGFGVVIQHPLYLAASCISAAIYFLLLKGNSGWKLLIGFFPLILFVTAINPLFNTDGETVLFYLFGNPYTLEALYYGLATAAMLVVMLLWFSCYSIVLTSDKFVCLFGDSIPALSLLLVMVLRMIPNLMRKARQIIGARKAVGKGAGEQSTNKDKVKDGMHILSALTDWALEGSIVTADSMRSRGYGASKRSSYRQYAMHTGDWLLLAIMFILVLIVLSSGGTDASYTPVFSMAQLNQGFAAYCIFLLIPSFLQIKEVVLWNISVSRI